MIFVLDANIWLSERLLRSAVGAAFLHAVRSLDAKILLPEATRNEVIVGVERHGMGAVKKIKDNLSTIRALLGSSPELELSSGGEFRQAAEKRFNDIANFIKPSNLSMEHFVRALKRVTEHIPPAETTEQFRDCLLWEALLDNLGSEECLLVSGDTDFTDKASKKTILAQALKKECGEAVKLYSKLKDVLEAIQPQIPPVNFDAIADKIYTEVLPVAIKFTQEEQFRLGQRVNTDLELYATENPHANAAIFSIDFSVFDLNLRNGIHVDEAIMKLGGQCTVKDEGANNLLMDYIWLFDPNGVQLPCGTSYARMQGSIFGTSKIPFEIRVPLNGP